MISTMPRGLLGLIRLVQSLAIIGAVILCTVPSVFWLTPEWVVAQGPTVANLGQHPMVVDDRARAWGALGSLPGIALGLYALWQLWRLFGEYGQGRAFASATQGYLRRFAWSLLAAALLAPLQRAWIGIALTIGNPPGQRLLVVSLSWNDYMAVLCAAVLLAIATVLAEAVRLAEENAAFV